MKKKDIKAFQGLEAILDENYEMLCDRIHLLELSHKRLTGMLSVALSHLKLYREEYFYDMPEFDLHALDSVINTISSELESKVL